MGRLRVSPTLSIITSISQGSSLGRVVHGRASAPLVRISIAPAPGEGYSEFVPQETRQNDRGARTSDETSASERPDPRAAGRGAQPGVGCGGRGGRPPPRGLPRAPPGPP